MLLIVSIGVNAVEKNSKASRDDAGPGDVVKCAHKVNGPKQTNANM